MKPIVRDILESDWWQKRQDRATEWAIDATWGLDYGECGELVAEILGPYYRVEDIPGLGVPADEEDVEAICEAILGPGWDAVENTHNMIRDAHTWAFELAALPEDQDISAALESAADYVLEKYDYPNELWGAETYEEMNALHIAIENVIRYEKGKIILDLDALNLPSLRRTTARRWKLLPKVEEIVPELEEIVSEIELRLDDHIDDQMARVDTSYRVDFPTQWAALMKDEAEVKAAREELFEFILETERRQEEAEQEEVARERREMERRTGQKYLWEPLYPEEP